MGDFVGRDFLERLDDGFDGTLSVGLDDEFEDLVSSGLKLGKKVFESDFSAIGFLAEGFGFLAALLGYFARGFFIFDDAEFQAGLRDAIEAEDFDSYGGVGFLEAFALFINQSAHAAIILAADDDVADAEGAFSDENGGRRAARFEARFDNVAFGAPVGIGLEFEQIGLEQNHFDEFVHALLGEG